MNLIANNLTYKPDNEFHLKDVSFNFKKGNLYTILGRTLSGKTTLLKTIAGLLNPDSGKIQFEEKEFNKIPVWERNVAMVYQQFINYPHLSVYENISFPLKQRKLDKDKIKNDVNEALKTVGLVGFENRKIQELSGGQQQRVALARSLAKKAKSRVERRRAAPERFDHIQDDPPAVRRLRHRPWANLGQEMRPLQHALLWARMPETTLGTGRPRQALQIDKESRRRRDI